MTTSTPTTRSARVQAIVDGARVRQALGQAALYRRLPDGQHEVVFRGERFVGSTLDQAIEAARGNTR